MYWIPAVLLFYIPSGNVVVHLNREMPLEGGLYQWAKLRFGDLAGFLVGLNLWASLVLLLSSSAAQLKDNFIYAAGRRGPGSRKTNTSSSPRQRFSWEAGWDHLLPAWFSRLHPRFRTPVGSIVCIALTTVALTILGNLGVGAQESFQLLNTAGIVCWALTYLVMFAIPLVAWGEKPSWDVRTAAASGFAMTLLYVILAAFPIIDVKNPGAFTAKLSGVVVCLNGAGIWHFRRVRRRRGALRAAA